MEKQITITPDQFIEALAKASSQLSTGVRAVDELIKDINANATNNALHILFGEPNQRDLYERAQKVAKGADNPIAKMLAERRLEEIEERYIKEGFCKKVGDELVWDESKLTSVE